MNQKKDDEKQSDADSSADQDSLSEPETDPSNEDSEAPEPDRLDQTPSEPETLVDAPLSANGKSDEDPAEEGEVENNNDTAESPVPPADTDPNTAAEPSQTDENPNPDAEVNNPDVSLPTGSAGDDLSAAKEPDGPDENTEARTLKKDSDEKEEDPGPTDDESNDSGEQAGSESSFNDGDGEPAKEKQEEKQNDSVDNIAEEDPSEQTPNDTKEQTEDLPELEPQRKSSIVKAVLTGILVAAVFSGFFIFDNKSNLKSIKKPKSKEAVQTLSLKTSQKNLKAVIDPDDPNYIYYVKIDEVNALREVLLRKNEEILALKEHYHSGIDELEKEILDELQDAHNITFAQAMQNKRIEYSLRTIQRRLAYIRQLDQPAAWAFQAAEDLLYIKRKALMDIHVAEIASGIDMNIHVQHMNAALNKYRPTANNLAIDMTDAPLESLETIWQQIQINRLTHASQRVHSTNQIISEQICRGDFSRLSELSEISVDSAKCIAEMQASDLFLNGLTEISPSTARHLFQWKGDWICLNGFRALSPRVAAYLFAWQGRWISLNGLTDFGSEIGKLLLQWKGSQLELMGLRYTDGSAEKMGIKYLAQWERSGGKLFVPKTVRKQIDEINRSQRPSA